jgi:hypothetical protein
MIRFYIRARQSPTDRPLYGLKPFSNTIAIDTNDLPTTSPHGSDFGHELKILGLALDPNATRGTGAAHRYKRSKLI